MIKNALPLLFWLAVVGFYVACGYFVLSRISAVETYTIGVL